MKNVICLWGTIGIMALAVSVRAADGLTQTLQHGLYEEEGNQNLDAAIKSYQSVIDQSQEQRKVVATALFRLGECYRKLGNTNEATAQYQRIIRDFSEQEQLVKLSRQNLGKAGGATPVLSGNGIPGTNPEAEELARIRAIVKDSPDLVNSRASGNTPLHTAAQSGFLSVAEFLLANGASVNAENDFHETPLHRAASAGHKSMVELLLAHGADVDRRNQSGYTALHWAAANGYKGIVEVLLAHKADVKAVTSDYGEQPLHAAAENGYAAVAEVLMDHGAELERQSSGRRGTAGTPLHLAAARGQAEVVRLLLQHKANVNSKNGNGSTPLHIAASKGNREVVEILLKGNANVNGRDGVGATALHAAANKAHIEVMKVLLEAGADPNLQDNYGQAPLYGIWNLDVMKVLLDHRADPNLKTRSGATALSELIHLKRPLDAVELLLDNHANPNVANQNGQPVLFSAVADRNIRLVELLLSHGADPNVLVNSATPLSWSQSIIRDLANATSPESIGARQDWERMAKLLLAHGANENLQRLSTISYRRPGWTRAETVFTRGTNDFNRYSLLELLAALWGPGWPQPSLQFPDLEKITIDRLDPATSKSSDVHVSSDYLGDCSKDFPLEWGDQISIPEVDHALNESWFLPRPDRDFLTKCLTRHVQIIVKQETNTVRLVPELVQPGRLVPELVQPGRLVPELVQPGPPRASARGFTPEEPKPGEEKTVSTFLLKGVIYGALVLRASSDTTHVHVRRLDPLTNRPREWTIDLGRVEGSGQTSAQPLPPGPGQSHAGIAAEPDLWLRDGDVIEIPEKR